MIEDHLGEASPTLPGADDLWVSEAHAEPSGWRVIVIDAVIGVLIGAAVFAVAEILSWGLA